MLSGSINFKTALENVQTRKLFMLHSVFLFLMICWTFGSWCRVQIFKRQNSVNLWKYRYRYTGCSMMPCDISPKRVSWHHMLFLCDLLLCCISIINVYLPTSGIIWWRLTKRPGPISLLSGFTLSRPWPSTLYSPHSAPETHFCFTLSLSASPSFWRTSPFQPFGSIPHTSILMSSGPQLMYSTGLRGTRKPFTLQPTFGLVLEEISWKWL